MRRARVLQSSVEEVDVHRSVLPLLSALALLATCSSPSSADPPGAHARHTPRPEDASPEARARMMRSGRYQVATFAGGCFWCMEPPFDRTEGVVATISGYTGGPERNPTYEAVSNHRTGHAESVQVWFDPRRVSYERLVDVYFHNIDPTTRDRQFPDYGHQYRTAIFWHDDAQHRVAERKKRELDASRRFGAPIVTEIVRAGPFYPAEEYHQNFYMKDPERYYSYRRASGRDEYIRRIWGTTR